MNTPWPPLVHYFPSQTVLCQYKPIKVPPVQQSFTPDARQRITCLYLATTGCKSSRRGSQEIHTEPSAKHHTIFIALIQGSESPLIPFLPSSSLNPCGLYSVFNLYTAKAQMLSMEVVSNGLTFPEIINDEVKHGPKLKGTTASSLYFKFPLQTFN